MLASVSGGPHADAGFATPESTGKPEAVQISVGLFFSDEPPTRTPVGLRLGRETIDIPPGEREYVILDSYVLPVDVEVLAIQPHVHYLARRMEAVATPPDSATRPLISIKDCDFSADGRVAR